MFHQGDLQSGIALALQSNKPVLCFVHDDSDLSNKWEHEFLTQDSVSQAVTSKSVALKIAFGSQEAQFLSAFAPITNAPRLLVITNGRLAWNLGPEVDTKEGFKAIILGILGEQEENEPAGMTSGGPAVVSSQAPANDTVGASSTRGHDTQTIRGATTTRPSSSNPNATTVSPPASTSPSAEPSSSVQSPSAQTTATTSTSSTTDRPSWVEQQRKRNADARKERDRVMAMIEADKRARREKQEAERKARQASVESPEDVDADSTIHVNVSSQDVKGKGNINATEASLQIRLPSGRSVRRKFLAESTVHGDVRPWVDEQLAADEETEGGIAYKLKHIRGPPEPAREIELSEEGQNMREIGLVPSANLVVLPIPQAASSYPGSSVVDGASNLFWGTLTMPGKIVTNVAAVVAGAVITLTGTGPDHSEEFGEDPTEGRDTDAGASGGNQGRSTGRVRTMAEMRAERDGEKPQLYNGNQLNFQSGNRPDDDPK